MKCSKIMTHKLSPRFHHHIKAVIITASKSVKFSDNALRHQQFSRREFYVRRKCVGAIKRF
jgi:hypothetical protein